MAILSETLPEFPTFEIFEDGKVLNLKTKNFLKGTIGSNGYRSVDIKDYTGSRRVMLVHRLLALCFIPNTSITKVQVNHIDGNKLNNSISNLEWVTALENHTHSTNTGLQKKTKSVTCITTNKVFDSAVEAAAFYGVGRPNISACCAGRRNSAGSLPDGTKLTWRFTNE